MLWLYAKAVNSLVCTVFGENHREAKIGRKARKHCVHIDLAGFAGYSEEHIVQQESTQKLIYKRLGRYMKLIVADVLTSK